MNWANSFREKLRKPCLQTDGRTDGQTSGWIQYTPFPPSVERGYNYVICNINRDDVNTIVSPCCVKIENIAKLPLHKQNKLILPLSQKSQTRTQSEVMLPLSQQASGEKAGVSNHVAYHSGNLPHIPKLTSSSHVHPFGIKIPKNHCFINVILQYIYSVLRSTQQKIHINNCVDGKISECLFDTAHKTPSAQEVETLKLQLSTYNNFLPEASFGLRVLSLPACVRVSVNHELVSVITRHNFRA